MESLHGRRFYLQLGCLLVANVVYGNLDSQGEIPAYLGQIDRQCWEMASHKLIELKKIKVENTHLWEFMMMLKESLIPRHNEIFYDLSQNFWDIYIDCVLSKSHGVGKRQLVSQRTILYMHRNP